MKTRTVNRYSITKLLLLMILLAFVVGCDRDAGQLPGESIITEPLEEVVGTVEALCPMDDDQWLLVSNLYVQVEEGMSSEKSFLLLDPRTDETQLLYSTNDIGTGAFPILTFDGEKIVYQCETGLIVLQENGDNGYTAVNSTRYDLVSRMTTDLNTLAEIEGGFLSVKNITSGEKVMQSEETLRGPLRWSGDNNSLLVQADEITLMTYDMKDGQNKKLTGGVDFTFPSTWVDILFVDYIRGTNDILIMFLCEQGMALTVLDAADDYSETQCYENGEITSICSNPSGVLYSVRDNANQQSRLMWWEYLDKEPVEVAASKDFISASWLSESGDLIGINYFDTANQNNRVEIMSMP